MLKKGMILILMAGYVVSAFPVAVSSRVVSALGHRSMLVRAYASSGSMQQYMKEWEQITKIFHRYCSIGLGVHACRSELSVDVPVEQAAKQFLNLYSEEFLFQKGKEWLANQIKQHPTLPSSLTELEFWCYDTLMSLEGLSKEEQTRELALLIALYVEGVEHCIKECEYVARALNVPTLPSRKPLETI